MTLLIISIALGLLMITVVVVSVRVRLNHSQPERIIERLKAVDVAALLNLLDREQDEFLRARLRRSEFRRIQRYRRLAAIDYVRTIGHNARLVLRWCEAARSSHDPILAGAAEEIAKSAVQVRLHAISATYVLSLQMLLPGREARVIVPASEYGQLRTLLFASGDTINGIPRQIASAL